MVYTIKEFMEVENKLIKPRLIELQNTKKKLTNYDNVEIESKSGFTMNDLIH